MSIISYESSGFVGVVIIVEEGAENMMQAKEIIYGLEEEGLPHTIISEEFHDEDINGLAQQAANKSVFDVGICCSANAIVLHQGNLPKEHPVIQISKDQVNLSKARLLGINAARLIKRMPLEEI
ncbi:MAG: glycerol dehydratase reactivase beta/small subunit family protein [Desulfobacterales bacterium]|nr:glycerol dehydratase reactivase beta/small subunit family protein [Desulfobacterales bacterium]